MLDLQPYFSFHCHACARDTPVSAATDCPQCRGPLSLAPKIFPEVSLFAEPPDSLWHYRSLLPVPSGAGVISLGEGATPLLHAPALAADVGLGEIRLKNEMTNPTGSFKDRQVAVGINWARALGHDTVVAVSSGNVGSSAAAYAARAGMRAVLLMHGQAAAAKIAQAQAYGATVIAVDDPSPQSVFKLCLASCAARGWYHLSTAGMYAPWNVEGAKTIAYELYYQYGGILPDWIVAPVGGGGLLGGIWRGLLDLRRMGLIARLPRLAGVQATGCAPLVAAIDHGWSFAEHLSHPWPSPDTIAGAIADDILFDGHTVLPAIRETGGTALAVNDGAMIAAQGVLARREGLLCEIASATTIAALPHLPAVDKDTRVCCIVSGSGLKDLARLAESSAAVPRIPASLPALDAVLGPQVQRAPMCS